MTSIVYWKLHFTHLSLSIFEASLYTNHTISQASCTRPPPQTPSKALWTRLSRHAHLLCTFLANFPSAPAAENNAAKGPTTTTRESKDICRLTDVVLVTVSLVSRGSWLLYIAWSSYFIFVDMIFVREKNLKKASCAQPRFSLSKRFCPPKDGWFENEVFSETHLILWYWSWKFETWIWEQAIKGVIGVWWANCNTPDLYTYIDGRTKKSIEVCRISSKE